MLTSEEKFRQKAFNKAWRAYKALARLREYVEAHPEEAKAAPWVLNLPEVVLRDCRVACGTATDCKQEKTAEETSA